MSVLWMVCCLFDIFPISILNLRFYIFIFWLALCPFERCHDLDPVRLSCIYLSDTMTISCKMSINLTLSY